MTDFPDHISAEDAGLKPHPGHELSGGDSNDERSWWRQYEYVCSCGQQFTMVMTAKNKANSRSLANWQRHVESADLPADTIVHVGTITKKRVTWKVVIFPRNYMHAAAYSGRWHYEKWIGQEGGWYDEYHWAVAADKGKSGKRILTLAKDKRGALTGAVEALTKAEAEGHEVEFVVDRDALSPPVGSPRALIAGVLDKAEEATAGTIADVEILLAEINEILSFAPILEAKRDELEKIRHDRTIGLLQ